MRPRPHAALILAAALAACSEAAAPDTEPRLQPLAAAIVGGDEYACALLADGVVTCSGALLTASGGPTGMISISGGEQHACGIHETGAIRCWGVNTHGRLLVPGGSDFRSVAPGTLHTCALRSNGEIVCWGRSDAGEAKHPEGGGHRAIAAARGGQHTCALRADGSIVCWGPDAPAPPVEAGWVDIALTEAGGCVQDAGRTLTCWGLPQLDRLAGVSVSAFSAGRDFVCAIRAGRILCAGAEGGVTDAPPPGDDFVQIGAGYRHACALRGNGTVACWGSMTAFPGVAQ